MTRKPQRQHLNSRHRPRRRFDPRLPADAQPRQRTKPKQTATIHCPRCNRRSTVRYRYSFAICACGWFLRIEPMARYGRTDFESWPVTVDEVRRVAPDGWEDAHRLPPTGATVWRTCTACKMKRVQTPRTAGLVVTTCVICDTAHPDGAATAEAVRACMESWDRRGLVKHEYGEDGQLRGVRMPSHEDIDDDAEIRQQLLAEQEGR